MQFIYNICFVLLLAGVVYRFVCFVSPGTSFGVFLFVKGLGGLDHLFTLHFGQASTTFGLTRSVGRTRGVFLHLVRPTLDILSFVTGTQGSHNFFGRLAPILVFNKGS